jgi:DNA-binding transcriptional MerR regulator
MRIGEVHALLRDEFPAIELSKIRYYEDKGLVRPSRSRKGYRLYSLTDVACLREAFRLAKEEFVPLRVIRQRLIEQGLLEDDVPAPVVKRAAKEATTNIVSMPVRPAATSESLREPLPTTVATPAPVATTDVIDIETAQPSAVSSGASDLMDFGATGARFSTEEFLRVSRLGAEQLRELISFALLSPREVAGQRIFDETDLVIAVRARALLERGVEVRHLQPVKRTVERQMDLLADLTAPLRQGGVGRAGADVVAESRRVAAEIAELRDTLVARALEQYFGR